MKNFSPGVHTRDPNGLLAVSASFEITRFSENVCASAFLPLCVPPGEKTFLRENRGFGLLFDALGVAVGLELRK